MSSCNSSEEAAVANTSRSSSYKKITYPSANTFSGNAEMSWFQSRSTVGFEKGFNEREERLASSGETYFPFESAPASLKRPLDETVPESGFPPGSKKTKAAVTPLDHVQQASFGKNIGSQGECTAIKVENDDISSNLLNFIKSLTNLKDCHAHHSSVFSQLLQQESPSYPLFSSLETEKENDTSQNLPDDSPAFGDSILSPEISLKLIQDIVDVFDAMNLFNEFIETFRAHVAEFKNEVSNVESEMDSVAAQLDELIDELKQLNVDSPN